MNFQNGSLFGYCRPSHKRTHWKYNQNLYFSMDTVTALLIVSLFVTVMMKKFLGSVVWGILPKPAILDMRIITY